MVWLLLIIEDIFANVRGMVYIDVGVGFAADVGVDVDCITKAEFDPHCHVASNRDRAPK